MYPAKGNRRKDINSKLHLLIKISVYGVCFLFFGMNTYAIFLEFWHNPTILSTKVYKPDNRMFPAPAILICNDTAFKEPVLYTDYYGFRNNTLRMEDVIIDVLVVREIAKSILNAKPSSIIDGVKEISTAFHGTCYQSHENLQVNLNIFLNIEDVVYVHNNIFSSLFSKTKSFLCNFKVLI